MDYLTGDLGTGGARECAVELSFQGRLGEPFVAFALARAQRLSLRGWIETADADSAIVVAEGPEALVDAFEICCSLGPMDARVEEWQRVARGTGLNTKTFERRG
ncbi:acylphosphatase [Nitratireductor mangrovi]|uniref:acylphosphatase n=1 Tax=Nitratireductor mangrovi TaxID=2599600 RepID=UPI0019821CF6|nr:acylphosphatase [Nitratireductor mangrovi]